MVGRAACSHTEIRYLGWSVVAGFDEHSDAEISRSLQRSDGTNAAQIGSNGLDTGRVGRGPAACDSPEAVAALV
ncbi:MAG: hypothetical protein ACRDYA_23005 [Egibacteraceae bacterium]